MKIDLFEHHRVLKEFPETAYSATLFEKSETKLLEVVPVDMPTTDDSLPVIMNYGKFIDNGHKFQAESLKFSVSLAFLREKLQMFYKGGAGEVDNLTFQSRDNEILCVFEKKNPQPNIVEAITNITPDSFFLPKSHVAGLKLKFVNSGDGVHLFTDELFFLGQRMRSKTLSFFKEFSKALGLQERYHKSVAEEDDSSVFEWRLQSRDVLEILFNQNIFSPAMRDYFDFESSSLQEIVFSVSEKNIHFSLGVSAATDKKTHKLPLHIFESRELKSRYVDFDVSFAGAKPTLQKMDHDFTDSSEGSVLRNVYGDGILSLLRINEILSKIKISPATSLSALSLKNEQNILMKGGEDFLASLSELIASIREEYGDLSVFKSYFISSLAYGWSRIDFEKAWSSFKLVLDFSQDKQLVYYKMSKLCDDFGQDQKHLEILDKWLDVSVHSTVKSYILRKKMKLLSKQESPQAIDVASSLLKIDPSDADAVQFILERNKISGDVERSIQLLTQAIKHLYVEERFHEASRWELQVAEIWRSIGRLDIAEQRIRSALTHDPDNNEMLQDLESILLEGKDSVRLLEFYKERFDFALNNQDRLSFNIAKEKLYKILRDNHRHNEIIEAELRVMEKQYYQISDLRDIEGLQADSDRYMEFIKNFQLYTGSMDGSSLNQENLAIILKIVKKHIKDADVEADYLASYLKYEFSQENLNKIEHSFRSRKLFKNLLQIYRECLERLTETEDVQYVMTKMLSLPQEITEEDQNSIAVSLMQMDEANDNPLRKRISDLMLKGEWQQVLDLTVRGLQTLQFHFRKIKWLRDTLLLLEDCADSSKNLVEFKIYQLLLGFEEDDSVAVEVLNKFEDHPYEAIVRSSIERLLASGVVPPVKSITIELALADKPSDIALYYELRALSNAVLEAKAEEFYQAYKYYSLGKGEETKAESCLRHVLECGEHLDLFKEYRRYVENSHNWGPYVDILLAIYRLDSELVFLEEKDFKYALSYLEGRDDLVHLTIEITQIIIERFSPTQDVYLLRSNALSKAGDVKQEKLFLKEQITDEYRDKFLPEESVLNRLKVLGDDDFLREYIWERLEKFSDDKKKARYLHLAIDLDVISPVEKSDAFEIGIKVEDKELIEKSWFAMVQDLSNPSVASDFYTHSREALVEMGKDSLWLNLISGILDKVSRDKTNENAFVEIVKRAGLELLEAEAFLDMSEKLLGLAHNFNKDDHQIWMPYYLVLQKNQNESALVKLLALMIPSVSRNLSILKSYPVTVESLESEYHQLSTGKYQKAVGESFVDDHAVAELSENPVFDWRQMVLQRKVKKEMTEKLRKKAFASVLEKHLALQVSTLLSGEFFNLQSMHSNVWRNVDAYDYPLDGKGRYPSGFSHPYIGSSLHQLIGGCVPALASAYKESFNIKYLAKKLKCAPEDIIGMRQPMRWDASYLVKFGFQMYREKLDKQRYVIFALEGLGEEIFFDGSQRSFYFDAGYYDERPISLLFHRILFKVWALKFNYYIPTHLDVRTQLLPFFDDLYERYEKGVFFGIKDRLMGSQSPYDHAFSKIDFDSVRQCFDEVGRIDAAKFYEVQKAMQDHIARLQLTETLDLVGIVEALSGIDLQRHPEMKLYEIFDVHETIENLILFACHIKI